MIHPKATTSARPVLAVFFALIFAAPAHALPPPISSPISADDTTGAGSQVSTGLFGDLQRTNFLLGDMFGLRSALSPYGITIAIQETSEIMGNPVGGIRQGADYDGLTQVVMQLDTQRAFGWHGGLFNISALQIHGRNLSADNLASLQTASGIEADRATRLWELWYDQKFLEEDRLSVRVGQQSADQEFIVNPNGAYFVNTMFGWPVVPSYDLPGGGPAYPLSAPAVRIKYRPVNAINLLAAVFSGSPAPNDAADSQQSNASGTSFPFNRGVLAIAEIQLSYPEVGGLEEPGAGAPLGHTYKLGAWYDSRRFDDLLTDNTGQSLASAISSGVPRQHRGNYSVYAVADQMVWRDPANPNRSVSVFGRAMGSPQTDRNLVDYSANGGVVYHAPFKSRPDDTIGLGFGYAHVSNKAAALDRDTALLNLTSGVGGYSGVRSSETFIEATYQYQLFSWCQLQPDAQYVNHPGGGIANPLQPTQRVKNELVLGLRTNILF